MNDVIPGAIPEADKPIELGTSFVPPVLAKPGATDDEIQAGTIAPVRSDILRAMEAPHQDEAVEKEASLKLQKAIGSYFNGKTSQGNLNQILTFHNKDGLSKKIRYQMCRGFLLDMMQGYGTIRKSTTGNFAPYLPSLLPLFDVISSLKDYFGNEMPQSDLEDFQRMYIGELAVPLYVEPGKDYSVGDAKNMDESINVMEKLAAQTGLLSAEDIERHKVQAGITIRKILKFNTGEWMYKSELSDDELKRKEEIGRLAEKYDISLPSKLEIFGGKVLEQVQSFEAMVAEIEQKSITSTSVRQDLPEFTKVENFAKTLRDLGSRFGEEVFPEEMRPLETWLKGIRDRIDVASKRMVKNRLVEEKNIFTATIERMISQGAMLNPEVLKAFNYMNVTFRFPEDSEERADTSAVLTEYRDKLDDLIRTTAADIQADTSKAARASDIQGFWDIRSALQTHITRLEEDRLEAAQA